MSSFLIALVFVALAGAQRRPCPCSNPNLCKPLQTPDRPEFFIFGGLPSAYPQYDWTHLTTIVSWNGMSDDLLCSAHSKGVRVVFPSGFGSTKDLHNATYVKQWVEQTVATVENTFQDGVNIDFEDEIDAKDHRSAALLTEATKTLREELHRRVPGSQLTFDIGWLPNVDKRYYEYKKLSEICDFLVMMDYDEQSAIYGPCKAGPTSSLPNLIRGTNGFRDLHIPAHKLVMALPWYGHDYPCVHQVNETVCPLAPAPWRGVECTDANAPEYNYDYLWSTLIPKSTSGVMWDAASSTPYFNYVDTKGIKRQVWFDTPESNKMKVHWGKHFGKLRGVSMYTADFIDYKNQTQKKSMWDSLNYFFTK